MWSLCAVAAADSVACAVSKADHVRWPELRPMVYEVIMDFFDTPNAAAISGLPPSPQAAAQPNEDDSEVVLDIKEVSSSW